MKEYHKIETLFERDMDGNKKLIEGKFRNKSVEYLKDNKWIFTEKVDGTNIRICWDGHKITFAGRTDNSDIPNPLKERLTEIFLNNETEELFEQLFAEKEVIFFGEGYGGKIQNGILYNLTQDFILFDIMVEDKFLERENVENIAKSFNLKVVPIVLIGTIIDGVIYVKNKPNSIISKEVKEMEGLVGRTEQEIYDKYGNRMIVKIKVCDFI